ncbi:MAG TPA: tripartite tricarboxylate transporter substrate binding protein [Burkholderiales bacterium]
MTMIRAAAKAGCVLAAILSCGIAYAQSAYPAKVVRVVVPFPAGGSNDLVARLVSQELSKSLGQQFVVDNRGGASGVIGADLVAKAAPDGYTLMVHSITHLSNGLLIKKVPYDTRSDFTPVSLLVAQPGVLVAHPALPVKTVKQFIALAKARPNEITYASNGPGGSLHLMMALFASMADVKLIHVPYKGGAPLVTSLLSGETQSATATINTVLPHIKSGRLRPLGLTTDKRSDLLPGVPTIAESGVAGYEFNSWVGAFGPKGMPPAIVERLHGEIAKVMRQPEVMKSLANQALDPWPATQQQFAQRVKADYDKLAKVIKLTGVQSE